MSKARLVWEVKINVNRIKKEHLFQGKNGKYLTVRGFESETPDEFGNAGFVSQSVSKEAFDRGEKGEIVGNWKHPKPKKATPAPSQAPKPAPWEGAPDAEDNLPF